MRLKLHHAGWSAPGAIFRGLAITLIFGLLVSTVLTLVVIPVMYYALMRNRLPSRHAGSI
jgi:multidrug efflux pump subunit AcrB